jgi:large subunit ribosomal protein LP2
LKDQGSSNQVKRGAILKKGQQYVSILITSVSFFRQKSYFPLKFTHLKEMRVIAAYLLATLGGNAHPDAAAINKILSSVGIAEADKTKVEKLISELKGKDLKEVIAAGATKLASLPVGGGSAPAASSAPAAAPAKEEKAEEKKGGKKKEEPKEEEEVIQLTLCNTYMAFSRKKWALVFLIKCCNKHLIISNCLCSLCCASG